MLKMDLILIFKIMANREYKNRKSERPFSSDKALHLTLRSDIAVGELSLAQPLRRRWLREYLPTIAKRFEVRIYSWSNNGNHLHLVVKSKERSGISRFLRVLCGVIARKVLRAEKGCKSLIRFWTSRPYSRVLSWGREYFNVLCYVERNILEANGQLPFRPRNQKESAALKEELLRRVKLNEYSRRKSS
jgi:REP element-mobilizing transposase RayT